MKIKYKHQRFQAEAAKCVTDVFQGQLKRRWVEQFPCGPRQEQRIL